MTITRIILLIVSGFAFYGFIGVACYNIGFKIGHRRGFCRGYNIGICDGIEKVWKAYGKRRHHRDGKFAPIRKPRPNSVFDGRTLSDVEGGK